jgi:putative oxidoreductase
VKRTLQDLASLAARMGVGGIFFANGWHKLEAGLTATGAQFAELGAPAPGVWAAATMLIELIGGTLLIAGLAVPAIGLLLFAEALAVFILTAGDTGLPLTGGSIELIVALGAASVLLAVVGAGRVSVDHMVVIKRREAEEAEDFAADAEADAVIAALREPRPGDTRPGEAAGTPGAATPSPADRAPEKKAPAEKGAATKSATAATSSSGNPAPGATGSTGNTGNAATTEATKAAVDDTVPKPRLRRPKRPDETTESRSEAPSPKSGDTLVAGRRAGEQD